MKAWRSKEMQDITRKAYAAKGVEIKGRVGRLTKGQTVIFKAVPSPLFYRMAHHAGVLAEHVVAEDREHNTGRISPSPEFQDAPGKPWYRRAWDKAVALFK